jgi:DNA repair protein RecO (recombination protein O)
MLHLSIQEEEKNEDLFTFLETALIWLDTHEETSNFHLILLFEITKFLGFYPDISDLDAKFFAMDEGGFSPFLGINCLSEHETNLLKKLIVLKFDSNQKVFNGMERQLVLNILLNYYSIHLDGFKKPKSLEVLKEVFA